MKQNQASRTAEYMALFRAIKSSRSPGIRLFEDRFAQEFLRPSLRTVANSVAHAALQWSDILAD